MPGFRRVLRHRLGRSPSRRRLNTVLLLTPNRLATSVALPE